jgi:hypothetical protein
MFGIAAHGDVERRFMQMRHRDRARRRFTIGLGPIAPEPRRHIESRFILIGDQRGAFLAQAPKHRVDETFIRKEAARFGKID